MIVATPLCDIPGCGLVHSVVGSFGQDAASSVFDVFIALVRDAAQWLLSHAVQLATGAVDITRIDLTQVWFRDQVHTMLAIAIAVVAPLLMAATIGAVAHQDLRRLGRAWGVALPVSVIGGAFAVVLTKYALDASDGMCQMVLATAPDLGHRFDQLLVGLAIPGAQLVAYVIYLLIILGSVLLWLELLLRAAAVYVAVFFLPLVLAGLIWPASSRMAKRLVELLVALILSKFVIVATLVVGAAAIAQSSSADAALAGAAILLLAAFAPFALLRLIPLVEAAAIGHLEGMARRPFYAAQRAGHTAAAVATGNPVLAMLRAGGANSKEASPAPEAVRAQELAVRPAWYTPPTPAELGGSERGEAGPSPCGDSRYPGSSVVSAAGSSPRRLAGDGGAAQGKGDDGHG